MSRRLSMVCGLLAIAGGLTTLAQTQAQSPPERSKSKIVVSRPHVQDAVVSHVYLARIHARRYIEVRAVVPGVVTEVLVREGQAVKQGDVLVRMSPTQYQARLDVASAEVKIAEIEAMTAQRLLKQQTISPDELAVSQAKLSRARAKADLARAELSLATIRAPFDGLVGRITGQPGTAVQSGDVLTTLSDNSGVSVDFDVPEAHYLDFMANNEQVEVVAPVQLALKNNQLYPEAGRLAAIQADFTGDTGTISFRADFPNPNGLLRHGQSGFVALSHEFKNATVIPFGSTCQQNPGADWHTVYVIDKNGEVKPRNIVVRHQSNKLLVVEEGLSLDDKIVVEGVEQVYDRERQRKERNVEKLEYEFREPKSAEDPAGK